MEAAMTQPDTVQVLMTFIESAQKGEFTPVQIEGIERQAQVPTVPEQQYIYSYC